VVSIAGNPVFDGLSATGAVSPLLLNALFECDMYVALDNLGADVANPSTANLIDSIWSFKLYRPVFDNTTNCAVMTNAYRWIDTNCTNSYPVACVSDTNPQLWQASNTSYDWYTAANPNISAVNITMNVCPPGYHFDVPSTARQNAALKAYFQNSPSLVNLWLKFNDIDQEGQWKRTWSGIVPYIAPTNTIWDTFYSVYGAAAEKWPYILGAVLLFFAICIPGTFFICRRIKKRRLQRGFKEFNDSVSLDDK